MNFYLGMLVVVGAPVLGVYLWVRLARSKDGERYLKQRMQGPFVPTDEKKE